MEPLSGIITALVTPFTEKGELKTESIKPLIDFQIKGGVDGLFLCGTAGLGTVMRTDQRIEMFKQSVKAAKGRVKLLAHVGASSTEEAVTLAREAEKAGVSAVGAVPPYFMKPDEESIITHFKAIAGATKLPVYIYNIPRQALNAVTPSMMLKLIEVPNIKGVKDSSRDFINVLDYLRVLPEDFTVICGIDSYIYPAARAWLWALGELSRGTPTGSLMYPLISSRPSNQATKKQPNKNSSISMYSGANSRSHPWRLTMRLYG